MIEEESERCFAGAGGAEGEDIVHTVVPVSADFGLLGFLSLELNDRTRPRAGPVRPRRGAPIPSPRERKPP